MKIWHCYANSGNESPYLSVCVTPDGWIWDSDRTAIKGEKVTLTWAFGLASGETFNSATIRDKSQSTTVAAIVPRLNFKQIVRPNTDILVTGQDVTLILSHVLLSDEHVYQCIIKTSTDPIDGKSKDTNLTIYGKY